MRHANVYTVPSLPYKLQGTWAPYTFIQAAKKLPKRTFTLECHFYGKLITNCLQGSHNKIGQFQSKRRYAITNLSSNKMWDGYLGGTNRNK